MALATVEAEHPDELRADFQQIYGLDIDGMGIGFSPAHAAALMSQLPSSSRVAKALDPSAEWDDATYLLSAIEYDLRILIWQNTKDAQKNRNKPKPNETPIDIAKKRERAKGFDRRYIDKILGREDDG